MLQDMKTNSKSLVYDGEKERTERQIKKEMNKIVREIKAKDEKLNGLKSSRFKRRASIESRQSGSDDAIDLDSLRLQKMFRLGTL